MLETRPSTTPRRADIQGLRAIAVALVVVTHVSGIPRGGFIGVDVFFVLSGYLITGLLLAEHARRGRIALSAFYLRRVKRLLPAAVLTLGLSLAAAPLVFPAQRVHAALVDAGWSVALLANWHFATAETDYFASDRPTSPFQHFWSLSVEEQFYLVVPFLLAASLAVGSARTGRRTAGVCVLFVTVASFAWAVSSTAADPAPAYFSTAARSWELGIGASIASGAASWRRIPSRLGVVLSWVGLLGIVCSAFALRDGSGFPAPLGLAPVISTALVLVGGANPDTRAPYVLRNRLSVALGDVSYSLYLWHFPVLVMVVAVSPDSAWLTYPIAAGLAVVTYWGVERPGIDAPWPRLRGRRSRHAWRDWGSRHRRPAGGAAVGAVAVIAVAVTLVSADRIRAVDGPSALPDAESATESPGATPGADTASESGHDDSAVQALQTAIRTALTATSWPPLDQDPGARVAGGAHRLCSDITVPAAVDECTFGPADAPHTMMLVGDSTAAHELDALIAMVERPQSTWRLIGRAGFSCPFLEADIRVDTLESCRRYRAQTFELIGSTRPDLLVVTNSYAPLPLAGTDRDMTLAEWSTALRRTLDRAASLVGAIVQIAPPPAGQSIESCYRPGSPPQRCVTSVSSDWTRHLAAARRADNGLVVDTRPLFCAAGKCPAFIGRNLVKQDFVHLTGAYARAMSPGLRELLVGAGVVPPGFPAAPTGPPDAPPPGSPTAAADGTMSSR